MHELESRFADWVLRARIPIILISLILVVIAASGARHLTITNSYRAYFSPEDPHLVAFERLENKYTKDDSVMLVLAPKDGKVFTQKFLSLVELMTEKAWQIPFANRVDSITNFQHTKADGDDLVVGDLIKNARDLSTAELERLQSIALAEPLLRKFLLADDAKVTAINVNILFPGIDETKEQPLMIRHARDLVAEMKSMYPDVDYYISGMGAFHVAASEAAIHDISVLTPISFGVMFVLIALLAGGLIGTVTTVLVFSMSVAATMGISGYLSFPITPTGAGTPNIILTVAIANSVHILISYFHELRIGIDKHNAIKESIRINLNPISLASITTAIGFLSMNFAESPPFRMMGTTVAIGVLISFVLAVTFLPALLAVLPTGRITKRSSMDEYIGTLAGFIVRRRRGMLWGTSIVIIAIVANVPRNEFNEMFFEYFGKSMEFRIGSDFMVDNLTGLYSIHYSLESGESGGISDPKFLQSVDDFANWFRTLPETEHVNTITDTMKRLNKNMHGDDPAMYTLPKSRDLAAQYLLLYEFSLPYGLDLNNQINVDKSSTRVVATFRPMTIYETLSVSRRAGEWLDENAPHIGHDEGSSMIMMFTRMMLRNSITMVTGTTLALGLISIVIIFALRSLKIGALSLVTNLAPIGMGFGIWGLINGEIGMALSVVASMTFGIVVDDTVHFLSKYLRARREQGLTSEEAVTYAFNTVGRALIVTSVVLVAGFLVLATSPFGMNSKMGLSVAIVIACALATVLLFLPPLLMKLEPARVTDPRPT